MRSTVYLPAVKAVRAAIAPMTMIIVVRGYAAMGLAVIPEKAVAVANDAALPPARVRGLSV
jgi:hypothetical protein